MNENGIDINDWNMPIYRVFSNQWFEELLVNNKNGLVNPTLWDDPFENFFLKNPAIDNTGELIDLSKIANSWYGQCWTMNQDSDAMWRIYSPTKDGVRVRTTISKLFNAFYDMNDNFSRLKYFIGVVQYFNRSTIEEYLNKLTFTNLAMGGQNLNFARLLCIKRNEFSHEKEVRLLFNDANSRINGKVASFDFDPFSILDEVALDPRLDEVSFISAKSKWLSIGCTVPIIQSDLYKFTPTTIKFD